VDKNKRLTKSKKGGKGKKIVDPFKSKQKYEIRAPSYFAARSAGMTICSKTTGNKISSENLKGRIFPINLADLKKDEEHFYRIIKLRAEEVQDRRVLTNFHGLQLTVDKLRSLVRKWQTLIEASVDVKTADGYVMRVFVITFTAKRPNQSKKTFYAQSAQIRQIRKKIVDIVKGHIQSADLKQVVEKFIHNIIEKQIETSARSIYPLNNTYIRKVKMLKTPKYDLTKLMDIHGDTVTEDLGAATAEPAAAPVEVVGDVPAA